MITNEICHKIIELLEKDSRMVAINSWVHLNKLGFNIGLDSSSFFVLGNCPFLVNIIDHIVNNVEINLTLKPNVFLCKAHARTSSTKFIQENEVFSLNEFTTGKSSQIEVVADFIASFPLNVSKIIFVLNDKHVYYSPYGYFEKYLKTREIEFTPNDGSNKEILVDLVQALSFQKLLKCYFNKNKIIGQYYTQEKNGSYTPYVNDFLLHCDTKKTELSSRYLNRPHSLSIVKENINWLSQHFMVLSNEHVLSVKSMTPDLLKESIASYQSLTGRIADLSKPSNYETNQYYKLSLKNTAEGRVHVRCVNSELKNEFADKNFGNWVHFINTVNLMSQKQWEKFLVLKYVNLFSGFIKQNTILTLMDKPTFYKDDFSTKIDFFKLYLFLSSHNKIGKLNYYLSSFCSLKQIIDLNMKLLNSNNLLLIGFLENLTKEVIIEHKDLFLQANIKDIYKKMLELNPSITKPLSSAAQISEFKFKDSVSQLRSSLDLKEEGLRMKHCVGGYTSALRDGDLIFHLKYKKHESTLHLAMNRDRRYQIQQHKSSLNSVVNFRLDLIAKRLKSHLNKEDTKKIA